MEKKRTDKIPGTKTLFFAQSCAYFDDYTLNQANEGTTERFNTELRKVLAFDFWREYCLARMVMEFAEEKSRLVFDGGNGSYSYLAYLHGITHIDPIERGYSPEMFLSMNLCKTPFFQIVTSGPEFTEEIKDLLKERFGEDNVSEKDGIVSVVWPADKSYTETTLEIGIWNDPFVAYAEQRIKQGGYDTTSLLQYLFPETMPPSAAVRYFLSKYIDIQGMDVDEEIRNEKELFLDALFDGTFDSVVRAVAAIRGRGVWKSLKDNPNAPQVYTRDDILKYLKITGDKEKALRIMEYVRKGRGVPEDERTSPLDPDFISLCDGIQFLVSEGSCACFAALICLLARKESGGESFRKEAVNRFHAPELLYGEEMTGKHIELSSFADHLNEPVIVSGKVADVTCHKLRGRFVQVVIRLEDDTAYNYLLVKLIIHREHAVQLKRALDYGKNVSVSGLIVRDWFENRYTLNVVNGIKPE